MRCMICDSEMLLMNVVPDDTMPVAGFERRTFMCSSCHDVEQQLAFVRPVDESNVEPVPIDEAPSIAAHQSGQLQIHKDQMHQEQMHPAQMHPANTPSIAPATDVQDEAPGAMPDGPSIAIHDPPTPGLLRRVVTRMRGRP